MNFDVVIMGGGLAGLTLALQLARGPLPVRIAVVDRQQYPVTEAAHKVGESTVELGAWYLHSVLGLDDALRTDHLRKLGLRFFLGGGSRAIEQRHEIGLSDFLPLPSYQIDRGRIENNLFERCRSHQVEIFTATTVREIHLGDGQHQIIIEDDTERRVLHARWLVDASGRKSLLARKLDLERPVRQPINAAWARFDTIITPDDWSTDAAWRARVPAGRRLSTTHLVGAGYWVWLIPLPGDGTSMGVVVDERYHDFTRIHRWPKLLEWLVEHEPQCAAALQAVADRRTDFKVLRHICHDRHRLISHDRWALTGDAGRFLDPFYSPGSDFIALTNLMIERSIAADLDPQRDALAEIDRADKLLNDLFLSTLPIYKSLYRLLGSGKPMVAKLLWDFGLYWGGLARCFMNAPLDAAWLDEVMPVLRQMGMLNTEVQSQLRRWGSATEGAAIEAAPVFIDYGREPWLRARQTALMTEAPSAAAMRESLALMQRLAAEIGALCGDSPAPGEGPGLLDPLMRSLEKPAMY